MRTRTLFAMALGCAAILTGPIDALSQAGPAVFKSGVFEPPRMAPELALHSTTGGPLDLGRYRGKVIALAFGFTHCLRICPTTLATLRQVGAKLGPAASKLQVIFVTVDPQRDSVDRLRSYLGQFDAKFIGATGSDDQLTAIRRKYGVVISREEGKDEKLGYQVHHSSSIFLIDPEGRLRLFVPFGRSAEDIADDIKILLR